MAAVELDDSFCYLFSADYIGVDVTLRYVTSEREGKNLLLMRLSWSVLSFCLIKVGDQIGTQQQNYVR